jgi:hypothetical protein
MEAEFDTGLNIISMRAEPNRKYGFSFTAYVDGISLRSSTLHLQRIRDTFLRSLGTAAGLEEEEDEMYELLPVQRFIEDLYNAPTD